MLNQAFESDWAKIYKMDGDGHVERYIATTAETRAICNDPRITGIDYTDKLQQACVAVLKTLDLNIKESSGVVVNIPGVLAGLPEDAWMSEFVSLVPDEPVDEESVPGIDEFDLGEDF